jgi:hypothetical protein
MKDNNRGDAGSPQGDVGAAILTTPWGDPAPAPGPIAGVGLPGSNLGERWSSRLVETASENRLTDHQSNGVLPLRNRDLGTLAVCPTN